MMRVGLAGFMPLSLEVELQRDRLGVALLRAIGPRDHPVGDAHAAGAACALVGGTREPELAQCLVVVAHQMARVADVVAQ
jgi:hypothetical protein